MGSALSVLRSNIRRDIAMEEEDFIDDIQLNYFINDGIRYIGRIYHDANEDYFLTSGSLTRVGSTSYFTLPTDIYINRIRSVLYDDGNLKYEIFRIKNLNRTIDDDSVTSPENEYRYILENSLTDGTRLRLHHDPVIDPSPYITVWYIRRVKQLTLDADTCDIPEFETFIELYAKAKCLEKIGVDPMLKTIMLQLEQEKALVQRAISQAIVDNNNIVESDLSFYDDFDMGC